MEIKSTRIKSADYNDATEVLTICFVRGGKYKYYKVPKYVFLEIQKSNSPGNYFDVFIKPNYMCKKD